MNAITSLAIREAIRKPGGKSDARRYIEREGNYPNFQYDVEAAYWNVLMTKIGIGIYLEAYRLLAALRPDLFDDEGFLTSEAEQLIFWKGDTQYDIEGYMSLLINDRIERKIEPRPRLQLDADGMIDHLIIRYFPPEPPPKPTYIQTTLFLEV